MYVFVWVWDQTAIISLYSIIWLIFLTETQCVYSAIRSGPLYIILLSAHAVYLCVCVDLRKTAIISLYSITWLIFITETECVYCVVRTGPLYIILRSAHTVYLCVLCGSENKQRLFPYTALTDWFFWDAVCLLHGTVLVFVYKSTFCPHSVFMCLYGSENKQLIFSILSMTDCVFYNWESVCLFRGTDCVFIYNSTFCHTVSLCVYVLLSTNSDYVPIKH
jgi:hypothetical protein